MTRRWEYILYYDEDSTLESCIACDVTIDDDGNVIEEHDSYRCEVAENGAPTLDAGVPVPYAEE